MSQHVFVPHTAETAPAEVRPTIEGIQRKLGYVPAAVGRLALAPQLLKGFMTANAIFAQTSLTPLEREVVVMTVATHNECHVCVAMHTADLTELAAAPELIEALRAQAPLPDHRLEALRLFTLAVLDHRGAVPEKQTRAFLDAGHTEQNALEVVLGVGVYTISTYANRLTDAPLDARLQPFAWAAA